MKTIENSAHAIDLRGRGRSEGERYYVEKMEDYTDDMATLTRAGKNFQSADSFES